MIHPHPQATHAPGIDRPAMPASVQNAARVMYAGAVVYVTHAVIYLATASATKSAVEKKYPHLSASTVTTVTYVAVIVGAVVGLIGAVMYLWIARSCKTGKNWARITGTVFFAISVLGTVYNSNARTTVNLLFIFLEDLIGLAAVALLWLGNSSAWFQFFKRPQL